MRDRIPITDPLHGELVRRDRARRDDIRRLRAQLKTPTHPVYDPDFPDDAVDTQIAFQGLPDAEPYYFMNGDWHPFAGAARAISYRIEGYIRHIPSGVETTIEWDQVLDDCVTYDKGFAAKTNDSMIVAYDPVSGAPIVVNKRHELEVTRDVRDSGDYESFEGEHFQFGLADRSSPSPNHLVPIVGTTPGFYVVEGGIGAFGPTPTGGPDPTFPEPFYINVNVGAADFANLSPYNSLRVMTTEIDVVGAFGATWTAARTVQLAGVSLSISHDAGFDIQGFVGLGITKVVEYATPFIGDDPYHAP